MCFALLWVHDVTCDVSLWSSSASLLLPNWKSFNFRHPRPGDPARVDEVLAFIQVACWVHESPCLVHSHHYTFFEASVIFLRAIDFTEFECSAKPLHLTLMGPHWGLHLLPLFKRTELHLKFKWRCQHFKNNYCMEK